MAKHFRVIDLRSATIQPERIVVAGTAEQAGYQVFGTELVRSGTRSDLVARVYWHRPGQAMNMVRLYRRPGPNPSAR